MAKKPPPHSNKFDSIHNVIDSTNSSFLTELRQTQNELFNTLFDRVNRELDYNDNNLLIPSANNLKALSTIKRFFNRVVEKSNYNQLVSEFINNFGLLSTDIDSYFSAIINNYEIDNKLLKNVTNQVTSTVVERLVGEGFQVNVTNVIIDIINDNIINGVSSIELRDDVRSFLVEEGGGMAKYASTITKDSLNTYNRTYTAKVSENLGLKHYYYSGTKTSDSRNFCVKRIGKYFTEDEVLSWVDLKWQGKKKGTNEDNIKEFLGGWNCEHDLVPVTEKTFLKFK